MDSGGARLSRTLEAFLLRGPALFHELEQVHERLIIGVIFIGGQLAGALVQLRGHLRGFFRRTTEHDQNFGDFRNFHGN
jgi:hypothetical protein